MDAISPFIGAILIVFGGLMAFMGSKFIFIIFSVLVGGLITTVLFLLSYNLLLDPHETSKGALIGLLVVASLIGAGIGYWSYKFSKVWAVSLIAAFCGIVLGVTLVRLAKVHSSYATAAGAILGAIAGFYLGMKTRRFVKSVGTSLIGSFLFVRGIGTYAGGYPSETDFVDDLKDGGEVEVNNYIVAYFGGLVVMTIGTSIFQLWYFRDDDDVKGEDEDAFANEDENRRCGCF